jgi:hypothetical protein
MHLPPFASLALVGLALVGVAGCSGGSSTDATSTKPTAPVSTPVACVATVTTTLPGITARVKNTRCDFTLAQAAAGITIDYEIVVAADLPALYTQSVTGQTQTALSLFSTLGGNGQRYCLCDTGPGTNTIQPLDVRAGASAGSFAWDGVNWGGPSDTGVKKGPAFPAGAYTLTLHGEGSHAKPAAPATNLVNDYAIDVTIPITLVD